MKLSTDGLRITTSVWKRRQSPNDVECAKVVSYKVTDGISSAFALSKDAAVRMYHTHVHGVPAQETVGKKWGGAGSWL